MKLLNNSGPAIFIYCVIAISLIISTICFSLYYTEVYEYEAVLWSGIVAFTIMYHLWLRIIMGNISKIFKKYINYKDWWFKEKCFEKKLYKILCVKKWKGKALTYNPELFDLKENSLEEIVNTTIKSETDHWINEIISISTICFGLIWGKIWLFILSAAFAMIFDGQFIIIKRYNRPRIIKILEKEKLKMNKNNDEKNYIFEK
mgnify:CR=1 FL=1